MADGELPITSGARERLLDSVLTTLAERYIFPEVAARIATEIRARAARGEYASITDGNAFAQLLTSHLRAAGNDKHLGLYCSADLARLRRLHARPLGKVVCEPAPGGGTAGLARSLLAALGKELDPVASAGTRACRGARRDQRHQGLRDAIV